MPEEGDFPRLVDWLADRHGKSVYIEVGTTDPDAPSPGDAIVVAMHATLGRVETATDTGRNRKVVMVQIGDGEGDRVYLDPERITQLQFDDALGAVRIRVHDSFYLGLTGTRTR